MHQGTGQVSVMHSLFYNNVAGSNNVEDGEPLLAWERCTGNTNNAVRLAILCWQLSYMYHGAAPYRETQRHMRCCAKPPIPLSTGSGADSQACIANRNAPHLLTTSQTRIKQKVTEEQL